MSFKLITSQKFNQTYVGPAEECNFAFSLGPEQLPGFDWVASQFISHMESQLEDSGHQILELYVWEDTAPTWTTDFKVKVIATTTEPISGRISFEPISWSIIILAVLAVVALGLITWSIISITSAIRYVGDKAPGALVIGAIGWAAIGVGLLVIVGITTYNRYKK